MLNKSLDRAWRVLATGFSFAVFGFGALFLSVTFCPVIAVTSSTRVEARRRIQRTLHGGCRFFIWVMKTVGVITYELHGIERLEHAGESPKGRLILANHPSLIDAVFLLAWTPEAVCITKQALRHNPFLRWAVSWSGYVTNGTSEELIRDCVATLNEGQSLIMFPEGTRTVPGAPRVFKRGAAWIAIRAQAEILPVTIRCEPIMLTKGSRWYQVPPRAGHFTVVVGAPLAPTAELQPGASPAQAAARLTQQLEHMLDPQRIGESFNTMVLPSPASPP